MRDHSSCVPYRTVDITSETRGIITSINSYTLASRVVDYSEGSLSEFGASSYQWAADFGMPRTFESERYYWVEERTFLERESGEALVAAIEGQIYKISFRFHDTDDDECIEFRERVYDYLVSQMGSNAELQEIDATKIIIWSGDEGNVILQLDAYDTTIILTLSIVRKAKRNSPPFFGRLFGR